MRVAIDGQGYASATEAFVSGNRLAAMRGAAAVAHENYGAAVATNLRMWEQVR